VHEKTGKAMYIGSMKRGSRR